MLVHLPYDSFATSRRGVRPRSGRRDRVVVGLKTTVYRTSDDSALLPALIEAAEAGKQAVCLVELKARFDERRNIEWSRAMEQAGVHVVYGFREPQDPRQDDARRPPRGRLAAPLRPHRHRQLQRGRPRACTRTSACSPTDEAITADVADLFNHLTGFGRPQQFRKILAAPFNLRSAAGRAHPRGGRRGAAPARRRASGSRSTRSPTRRSSTSCTRRRRPGRDRHRRALRSACCGPACPGCREHPRAQRGRPLPRAQPRLSLRGRRPGDVPVRQRRHDAAQPRPPDRGAWCRSRIAARADELNAALEALLADNAQAWVLDASGQLDAPASRATASATGAPIRC